VVHRQQHPVDVVSSYVKYPQWWALIERDLLAVQRRAKHIHVAIDTRERLGAQFVG
jgi:hypothetical protein